MLRNCLIRLWRGASTSLLTGTTTGLHPYIKEKNMAKATRLAFGEALAEVGATNSRVVAFDADLSKSTMSSLFAKKFPDRFFEMGIQEANMIGAAAGMALSGKIPFICSFACFITGRYDMIRMSIAYSKAGVRVVGTHAGIGIGEDGNSQMGLEDVGLMRGLPNMIVLQPADELETRQMIQFLANEYEGPAYIRLTRQNLPDVSPAGYQFKLGRSVILRNGKDVTCFASGGTVPGALQAAEQLAAEGIDVRVVNLSSINRSMRIWWFSVPGKRKRSLQSRIIMSSAEWEARSARCWQRNARPWSNGGGFLINLANPAVLRPSMPNMNSMARELPAGSKSLSRLDSFGR
ncbi:MAG: 1-deoxy-D-xylulose-5-phosphate synthase [Candidatus Hinthialibacteria bacterium OLB16]|nr:MAG: 1-deoxy-D-xylulose-5-phosphate synthase [Candidatus Hinthialibacteria bacterium OLB16]